MPGLSSVRGSTAAATRVVQRERWSSHVGFLAAAIGSAVGLGNLWRFPYVVGQSGGGAFFIPYFLALLACGLPLMMFEIAAGREYRRGMLGTVRAIQPRLWLAGLTVSLIGLVILSYYLVVTGWTLAYLVATPLGLDTDFQRFVGSWAPLAYFGAATATTVLIVRLGVRRGIETASKALLPVLGVIILLLIGYGASLDGWDEAVQYLFKPDLADLLEPRTWAVAFGQAFFSLGVGLGVMVTYGSYLDRHDSIPQTATVVAGADTLVAMLAGLAVFPLVFSFGASPNAGPQLALQTLPALFSQMPFGVLVGTVFYLLLFIAGITSAMSLLEMVVAAISDWTGWSHARSLLSLVGPLFVLGLGSALSYSPVGLRVFGEPLLDVLDVGVGTLGLLVSALLTSVVLFWMGRPEALVEQMNTASRAWIGRSGLLIGRYVIPVSLSLTLLWLAVDAV